MNYRIFIFLLFVSSKSFSQPNVIDPSKPCLIRIGRPATENNQPLFILDGAIINEKEFQNIKPEIIESVTILKDTSATALFGKSGINGVILIKSKKYSKSELRKMKKKKLQTAAAN